MCNHIRFYFSRFCIFTILHHLATYSLCKKLKLDMFANCGCDCDCDCVRANCSWSEDLRSRVWNFKLNSFLTESYIDRILLSYNTFFCFLFFILFLIFFLIFHLFFVSYFASYFVFYILDSFILIFIKQMMHSYVRIQHTVCTYANQICAYLPCPSKLLTI